jgi:hypothetical protein
MDFMSKAPVYRSQLDQRCHERPGYPLDYNRSFCPDAAVATCAVQRFVKLLRTGFAEGGTRMSNDLLHVPRHLCP